MFSRNRTAEISHHFLPQTERAQVPPIPQALLRCASPEHHRAEALHLISVTLHDHRNPSKLTWTLTAPQIKIHTKVSMSDKSLPSQTVNLWVWVVKWRPALRQFIIAPCGCCCRVWDFRTVEAVTVLCCPVLRTQGCPAVHCGGESRARRDEGGTSACQLPPSAPLSLSLFLVSLSLYL